MQVGFECGAGFGKDPKLILMNHVVHGFVKEETRDVVVIINLKIIIAAHVWSWRREY